MEVSRARLYRTMNSYRTVPQKANLPTAVKPTSVNGRIGRASRKASMDVVRNSFNKCDLDHGRA